MNTLCAPALAALPSAPVAAGLGVGALLLAAAVVLMMLRGRRARRGAVARPVVSGTVVCPACQREFPSETTFCPADARRLVSAEAAAERRASTVHCPRCRRAFDGANRYCPFDAEELAPQLPWSPHEGHDGEGHSGSDKICPTCACRYGLGATFCGKDGSELMTVN